MAKGDGGPAGGAVGPMDRLDLADPLAEIEAADEMIVVNLDHRRTIVVHNASLGDWWIGLVIQAYSGIVAPMSEEERARGIAAAKLDRQAVFKGDCVSCHAKNIEGKYGQQLFASVCAVCHEGNPRASMVPDLHNLKDPTNEEFWRTWITAGKAGTLMPAFATSQGGPLNDMQIASLAAYLNAIIPPKAVTPAATK